MELGLSLGEAAMADAGRELVLGLGVGVRREEVGERVRREEVAGRKKMCAASPSPEPSVRLTLVPLAPSLGLPWLTSDSRHLPEASSRGFDVNRAPASASAAAEEEDEGDAAAVATLSSSPNNSSGSLPIDVSAHGLGLACATAAQASAERSSSRASDEDDGGSARKKLRLSKEQSAFLEESFKEHSTLNPKQKLALAKQLNLRPRQVEVWFQNRRARTKLKQTEVDCEYLKRCCETLTEENRRLHKELAELRALKTAHPFYMHLPATTLSMCPSCERVASNPASASTSASSGPATAAAAPGTILAAAPQPLPSSFAALFSVPRGVPLAAQPRPQPPASNCL